TLRGQDIAVGRECHAAKDPEFRVGRHAHAKKILGERWGWCWRLLQEPERLPCSSRRHRDREPGNGHDRTRGYHHSSKIGGLQPAVAPGFAEIWIEATESSRGRRCATAVATV